MISISDKHNIARLAGSRDVLMAGPGIPLVRLYDGVQPDPGEPPDGNLIATAGVASAVVSGGVLLITLVSTPVIVMSTGTPTWARILDAAGYWWMDGAASEGPGALVTLDTPGPYYYGGRIVIDSVVIG